MTTEERLVKLETTVENIRDNHLHTIEAKINKLDNRLWMVLFGVAVSIVLPVLVGMLNAS